MVTIRSFFSQSQATESSLSALSTSHFRSSDNSSDSATSGLSGSASTSHVELRQGPRDISETKDTSPM